MGRVEVLPVKVEEPGYWKSLRRFGGAIPLDPQQEIAELMQNLEELQSLLETAETHKQTMSAITEKRKTLNSIIEAKRSMGVITEDALRLYLNQVMRVIRTFVKDELLLKRISDNIRKVPLATTKASTSRLSKAAK